jgi:hypothetical protein
MANQSEDLSVLSDALYQLLKGELKVGVGLLKVGGCLQREGRNKEWIKQALGKWVAENEDMLPFLVTAMVQSYGVEKVKAWASQNAG